MFGRPSIEISQTPFGKPLVLNDSSVEFNISHADEYVAVAISSGTAVGVDLESRLRKNDVLKIAAHYFTDQENSGIQLSSDPQKYFYQLWTLKEAYVKARGMGLRKSLSEMAFSIKDSIAFFDLKSPANDVQFYSCALSRDIVMGLCYLSPEQESLQVFAVDAALLVRPVRPTLLLDSRKALIVSDK